MKKYLLFTLLISNACFAQFGKKKFEAAMEKIKVSSIKTDDVFLKVGDTLSIGYPYGQREKFSFIMRRLEYYDITAMTPIESLKLDVNYSTKDVVITNIYFDKENPQAGVSVDFLIAAHVYGMILINNAIKTKEVIKLNGKFL